MRETYALEGCRIRSEICLESWWELRTIMLCRVAGCWGMLIMMDPTLNTAALLVFRPRWALYRAWDLAMLHLTTVLKQRIRRGEPDFSKFWCLQGWNCRQDVSSGNIMQIEDTIPLWCANICWMKNYKNSNTMIHKNGLCDSKFVFPDVRDMQVPPCAKFL